MAIEVVVRKWGNSLGVVFPKILVEKKHLEENKKILIEVIKEADLKSIFGSLKGKVDAQKFKDIVRAGWM